MKDPLAGDQPVESLDEGSPPRSDKEVDPLKLIDTQVVESYEKRYQDARPQVDYRDHISEDDDSQQEDCIDCKAKIDELLSSALKALCLTRDYLGETNLPALDGWEWYEEGKRIADYLGDDNEWAIEFRKRVDKYRKQNSVNIAYELIITVREKSSQKKEEITLPIPLNKGGELVLLYDSNEDIWGWSILSVLTRTYADWDLIGIAIKLNGNELNTELEILDSNQGKFILFKYADGKEGRISLVKRL